MLQITDLLINFAIIFFGNLIAPNYIIINSWKDAVLAALFIWFIQIIGFGLTSLILALCKIRININTSFKNIRRISIFAICFSVIGLISISIIAVILAEKWLNGFNIISIPAHIIVIILISLFPIFDGNSSSESNSQRS